ncbi:acetoacetate metabolism regulatory protein AtoC [Candidatus Magnetomorum sp. HK-1]|nr:acetoacetate metabolism regulatory protein AtoC [Candidatus Magnetomorum sp. HK-1]
MTKNQNNIRLLNRKNQILFLGQGDNNLELMAECLACEMNKDVIGIMSATITPPKRNPIANNLMKKIGFRLSNYHQLTSLDIEPLMFDMIITLGNFDQSCRPTLPGMPPHFHWNIPDPPPNTSKEDQISALKQACEQLMIKIKTLFDSDLLHALFIIRRNFELVLDNLMDGVMAHTTHRRIFFFNRAAENITGFNKEEVIGKDCHEVFPGRFCGGNCLFCEGEKKQKNPLLTSIEIQFVRRDGDERLLKMSAMPLTNQEGRQVGALLSFKDDTELSLLKHRLKHHHSLCGLIGKDPKILEIFNAIRDVSIVNVPVLIEGESGTGKELVANAIHELGAKSDMPFVAVNCGALPEDILESELFGHVKGAFTGAINDRKGRFELANGGTLFLDEVGELSLSMQVKLLRVVQEKKFERVGGEKSISVDVRIISATNQNLRKMMEKKRFRRDLFYRLCVIPISIPPLRERKLDIPMLVEHFLEVTANELNRKMLSPSNETLDFLTRYSWPGNVRELRNAIEYAYVKCRSQVINVNSLPPEISKFEEKNSRKPGPIKKSRESIIIALEKAEGNKKRAAQILGVGRATLYRYLDYYGLK